MKKVATLLAWAVLLANSIAPLMAADAKPDKRKAYPLDKCIVSDEKLGEMGESFVFVYNGQEIKLCCKSCQKDFKRDPARYLKKIAKTDSKAPSKTK